LCSFLWFISFFFSRKKIFSLLNFFFFSEGVYLTDLVFIEEGNKDTVNGLINFDKSRKIAFVIREIQQYQQTPYCIAPVHEIQVFFFFLKFYFILF